jgi:hypothetical protein
MIRKKKEIGYFRFHSAKMRPNVRPLAEDRAAGDLFLRSR